MAIWCLSFSFKLIQFDFIPILEASKTENIFPVLNPPLSFTQPFSRLL